jgi:hypothetical protein
VDQPDEVAYSPPGYDRQPTTELNIRFFRSVQTAQLIRDTKSCPVLERQGLTGMVIIRSPNRTKSVLLGAASEISKRVPHIVTPVRAGA